MGSSWCKIILKNETPYTWHYSGSHVDDPFPNSSYTERKESGTLKAREEKEYWPDRNGKRCMFILKYGDHQHNSFSYPYSGYQHTTFTIRESLDRSVIELHCSTHSVVETCPNYAKKEKDQQRREEEQRRQERQERERRIEEEISKETEEARRSLTEAKLNLSPSLREQEGHRQRTHVLQQVMGDHETVIKRDEV
ncbi:differentially expressed in FDCP 6 isoform X3 [Oncorhynchus mykiss]|uniref:differentially expressed in FDCP 6 isoform X3 n=1 Tax=Oncorhynchus mykiss TaxID=8022 RepID=UPI001877BC86|nr:differentially expressed in FDCP 6 isoform X3 [Oncorhynchus mykiss]